MTPRARVRAARGLSLAGLGGLWHGRGLSLLTGARCRELDVAVASLHVQNKCAACSAGSSQGMPVIF